MTRVQLLDLLKSYLKQIAPDSDPSALQEDDFIKQKLGLDSFDFLQFIILINDELKINIPEENYGQVLTLKNLSDYLVHAGSEKLMNT